MKKRSNKAAPSGSSLLVCSPSPCARCGRETRTPERCACCEQEDELKLKHDKAWEKGFIVPIAKEMKSRGVAYMVVIIRDDGKASYVLDTEIPENDPAMATPTDTEDGN